MLTVTLATHQALPDGAPDDLLLAAALRARGAGVRMAVWDDPDVDWTATPLTVVRSTWDYHLKVAAWHEWLDLVESSGQLVNGAGLIRWNGDKRYLIELERAGVAVVPTIVIDFGADAAATCAALTWQDVVFKPAIGASSFGARRFTGGKIATDGAEHLRMLLRKGRALIQPYQVVVETERERSLIFIDGCFTHAFTKPAFYSGVGGEALQLHVPSRKERDLAERVLGALPEQPQFARLDMLPTPDGPVLAEAELIEPQLALQLDLAAAGALADAIISPLRQMARDGPFQRI